MTPSKCKDNM